MTAAVQRIFFGLLWCNNLLTRSVCKPGQPRVPKDSLQRRQPPVSPRFSCFGSTLQRHAALALAEPLPLCAYADVAYTERARRKQIDAVQRSQGSQECIGSSSASLVATMVSHAKLFAAFPQSSIPMSLDAVALADLFRTPLPPVMPVDRISFPYHEAIYPGGFIADSTRRAVGLVAQLACGLSMRMPRGPPSKLLWLTRWGQLAISCQSTSARNYTSEPSLPGLLSHCHIHVIIRANQRL